MYAYGCVRDAEFRLLLWCGWRLIRVKRYDIIGAIMELQKT